MSSALELTRCEVLVVGAGAAGLAAALGAGGTRVVVIGRTSVESASFMAQGGIAGATGVTDLPDLHAEDTLRAGRGISRRSAVDLLVQAAPGWIAQLEEMGLGFGSEPNLEAGHSRRRVHEAGGSQTGAALTSCLLDRVRQRSGSIEVTANEQLTALWLSEGRCIGARTTHRLIQARAVVLATGGYAALFGRTTNPQTSQGDGVALAYLAGAAVADLEFVQFHPTTLRGGGLLLTEALRGDGAVLLDDEGQRFVDELAPRDEVARAIFDRGSVWLDARRVDHARFGPLAARLLTAGYDVRRELIPVAPAAHYTMGGIATDLDGRTTVAALYAAGEAACTGVHGANRLASNSLLECLVFGERAGASAACEPAVRVSACSPAPEPLTVAPPAAIAQVLWEGAGLVRNAEGLAIVAKSGHVLTGLIGQSALLRRESRGSHYRVDYPVEDPTLAAHLVLRIDRAPQREVWN